MEAVAAWISGKGPAGAAIVTASVAFAMFLLTRVAAIVMRWVDQRATRRRIVCGHLLYGADLRRLPLIERREKLRQVIPVDARSAIQFSDHYEGEGTELFKQACAMGLEGIVSKRALSPYKSGPSKFR